MQRHDRRERPDAALGGLCADPGAAGARRTMRPVDRLAVTPGCSGGVYHPALNRPCRDRLRLAEHAAVEDRRRAWRANPFKGDERAVPARRPAGKDLPDKDAAGTYCDRRRGSFGVTAEELGSFTAAVGPCRRRRAARSRRPRRDHAADHTHHKGGRAIDLRFLAARTGGELRRASRSFSGSPMEPISPVGRQLAPRW